VRRPLLHCIPPILIAVGSLTAAADASRKPAVTKTVVKNLPENANFQTIAVAGKIYAFKFGHDDLTDAAGIAAGGAVYAYHPAANQWEARSRMPVKAASYELVLLNGRIYVVGGFTAPDTPCDALQEYDPATNRWTIRRSMPTARSRVGIVILDGSMYVLGGKTGGDSVTDAVEVYDPGKDAWTRRRSLSLPLMGVKAVTVNGKIFKLGGVQVSSGKWTYVMDFEQYDPPADTWTRKAPWTFEREPLDMAIAGGRLFVMGGGAFTDSSVHSLKEYDFASDRWVFRRNMPEASAHTIHPSWTSLDGRLYSFGGGYRADGGWRASDRALRYDPATDVWEELPPLAEPKIGMGVAVIGSRMFLIGGEKMGASGQSSRNQFSDDIEIYQVTGEAR